MSTCHILSAAGGFDLSDTIGDMTETILPKSPIKMALGALCVGQ
jgi:hypothetical protein